MVAFPERILEHHGKVSLSTNTVAILGCGSVGSLTAWAIASAGVGTLLLADKDRVEVKNLRRHVCGADSIGERKPVAVAHYLASRFPTLRVETYSFDFLSNPETLRGLLARCSVASVAVDVEAPKHLIDGMARELNRPVIYAGVYGGGWAGEVILTCADTPCYGCTARNLGRVGVNVELEVGSEYALPLNGVPESHWPLADLTSLMPVAAFSARLVSALMKSQHGEHSELNEFMRGGTNAWRLLFRDVPEWGDIGSLIRSDIRRDANCWTCGKV